MKNNALLLIAFLTRLENGIVDNINRFNDFLSFIQRLKGATQEYYNEANGEQEREQFQQIKQTGKEPFSSSNRGTRKKRD